MTTVQQSKEEFKELYKKYIIIKTGKWTKEDEEELAKICKDIEKRSTLLAILISVLIYGTIVALVLLGFRLIGLV